MPYYLVNGFFWLPLAFTGVFFRTKSIKETQLVQFFRDKQGQPRQREIASLGDAPLPESEKRPIALAVQCCLHERVYDRLGSDWRPAFPAVKSVKVG